MRERGGGAREREREREEREREGGGERERERRGERERERERERKRERERERETDRQTDRQTEEKGRTDVAVVHARNYDSALGATRSSHALGGRPPDRQWKRGVDRPGYTVPGGGSGGMGERQNLTYLP